MAQHSFFAGRARARRTGSRPAVAVIAMAALVAAGLTVLGGAPASAAEADSFEPDDSYTAASPITVGAAPQQHTLHHEEDEDWVVVHLAGGTTYEFETASGTLDADVDTAIELYDSDGVSLIDSDDDGGTDIYYSSIVHIAADAGQTVYLRVFDYAGSSGAYALTVKVVSADPGDEEPGDTVGGTVSLPEKVDFGTVAVGSAGRRTVLVKNVGDSPLTVESVSLEGAARGFRILQDDATGTSIPPGGSREVVVEYSPTATFTGPPDAEYRMMTNLVGEYIYSGGVVTGVTLTSGFQNLGGAGTLRWRVTACQPDTTQCVPVLDSSGSGEVLGGATYMVKIVMGAMVGSGRVQLVAPVSDAFSLEARPTGLQSVRYVRAADKYLMVDSSDPENPRQYVDLFGLPRAAAVQRPDGKISTALKTGYIGNGIYNTTALRQTKVVTAKRTRARTFYVRVQNDGTVTNTFRVRGTAPRVASTVRYFSNGVDVTKALRSTLGLKVRLAPGAQRLVTAKVRVLRAAVIGSRKPTSVTATWAGDGVTRADTVKGVVKVVR